MTLINLVLGLLLAAVLVPVLVLIVQVIAAALRSQPAVSGGRRDTVLRPRLAVLMPAHNESAVIVRTLLRIIDELAPGDRVLVVADNCSDDTAALAAGVGAEVVVRHCLEKRGKSYALEFGIAHLGADPPDVVVIVDADCHVEPGSIERLAHECVVVGRPVQALYLMAPSGGSGLAGQVAAFAWVVKNWVRPLGMRNLGLGCLLMGTGTAFPWRSVTGFPVANAEMAEDYKFGIDLALSGYPAVFLPEARVSSSFPTRQNAVQTQRTRWEHGHLQLILREVPRLVWRGATQGDARLVGVAADLSVPPLAFLALLLGVMLACTAAIALAGGGTWPLVSMAVGVGLFVVAIGVAWQGWGRAVIPLPSLIAIPAYVLAKVPMYLRYFTRRQRVWIKTERD